MNLTQKIIQQHLVKGRMHPGEEIGLKIDQTLTQDATGTLVMLELEAMQLQRVRTEVSVQYVDHNLIQEDSKNPDDHLFLESACRRFGLWFSRPGGGVSHPLHQHYFGKPGATLLGSDSHTCAAGALGMLAIGAGGLEVALAMAGEPYFVAMPRVWGVHVTGALPPWVSAKDVILEMLRRHGVSGGVGKVIEYTGPGLEQLSAMDRHVIANMGAELGATGTMFPADRRTREYLAACGRESDFQELQADADCSYDLEDELDLASLEPLVALPSSPGNVKPVHEVEGMEIQQAYLGSSANPAFRDFAMAARIVHGKQVPQGVSLDINPSSRSVLLSLIASGDLTSLLAAGGRLHQAGCNGCIGMGQAPATGRASVRTVPRNFPGRSGTPEDRVLLASPETAAASALKGVLTDPRGLDMPYPEVREPAAYLLPISKLGGESLLVPPLAKGQAAEVELVKGPNVADFPEIGPLPNELRVPVLLKVGDDISTDEILPAGAKVLPLRSNIPAISRFAFEPLMPDYAKQAEALSGGHAIVAGENYGQGSSREHAALAPRYLGLRVVLAKSFARIHWQNLVNFGVLPLTFENAEDYQPLERGDKLELSDLHQQLAAGGEIELQISGRGQPFKARHNLSDRQREVLLAGGLVNWMADRTTNRVR